MEDLFRSYWWLLFPLGWMVAGGVHSILNYFRQKETLKLIRTYAEKGQEPPASLLKILEQPIDAEHDWSGSRPSGGDGSWFSVVLFGLLAGGFGYASWMDMYGAGEAFLIVAFVLGALAAASLVSALVRGRRGR